MMIIKNMELLKNPLNTLSSDDFSFLQFISLNTCIITNVWKNNVCSKHPLEVSELKDTAGSVVSVEVELESATGCSVLASGASQVN